MDSLPDDDLYTQINCMISAEKFEKIVLFRLNKLMPSFSNCIHFYKEYIWVTCCQSCKFELNSNLVCNEAIGVRDKLKANLTKRSFKVYGRSQAQNCDKCAFQICVFCSGIYELRILKKLPDLHSLDLYLKEDSLGGFSNICRCTIDKPRKRSDLCGFDVCLTCEAYY